MKLPYRIGSSRKRCFLLPESTRVFLFSGATYVDDHVKPREASSFYLSFIYVGAALGPVFGYLLGAFMLTFDIARFLSLKPQNISIDMRNWSGAWWGGYILFSIILSQTSWLLSLFPKTLPSGRHDDATCNFKTTVTASLRKMSQDSLKVMRTSSFLIVTVAACFECAMVAGFSLFLPKYMENQFYVSKSVAGILTGSIAIPAAALGIIFGGWINRRYKMTPPMTAKFIAQITTLTIIAFMPLFFLHCSPDPPVGFHKLALPEFMPHRGGDFVQKSLCTDECSCSPRTFQPVCDVESQTSYMSPCTAGCSELAHGSFSECSCSVTVNSSVTEKGLCGMKCMTTLVLFLLEIFFIAFLVGSTHIPVLLLTLRSVSCDTKSLALALQMVFIRVLAYIPAPMTFGAVIDVTCILWSEATCGEDQSVGTGSCLFYNLDGFHRNYVCLAFALQTGSCFFFWVNYVMIRRNPAMNGERTTEEEDPRKVLRARISTAVALQPMKHVAMVGLDPTLYQKSYVTA